MKICIVGAGAVGGFVGVMLARAGHEVSLVARGAHLAAMRAGGVRLETGGKTLTAHPAVSDDPAAFGPQDIVILSVKAPALCDVARRIGPLLGPETPVVTAMNGLPWWFFTGFAHEFGDRVPACIDPDGALAASIAIKRIIGCVVHLGCSVPEPGVIRHGAGNHLILGEPSGEASERAEGLAVALTGAGFGAAVSPRIRQDYWLKLLGNFNFGPVSVLTGATNEEIASDPGVRQFLAATMAEAIRVGERFGLEPGMSIEERIDLGAALGAFKTSMLQDFAKGRPLEIDTIVKVVAEMGAIAGEPTPMVDAMLALLAQKARLAGLYGGAAGG